MDKDSIIAAVIAIAFFGFLGTGVYISYRDDVSERACRKDAYEACALSNGTDCATSSQAVCR